MKTSPTQRALAELRKLGFTAAVVEKWNPHAHIRQDLFGCIDIIAVFPGFGILAVQATSGEGGNHAARRAKAISEPRLRKWLESGGRFEVWSFRKAGERGKRKLWAMRRDPVVLDDLPAEPPEEIEPLPLPTGAAPLFAGGGVR